MRLKFIIITAVIAAAFASSAKADYPYVKFQSPTGNLKCIMADESTTCVSRAAPGWYASVGNYGAVNVSRGYGTGWSDRRPTLGYGRTLRFGVFRCTNLRSGIVCREVNEGHGFKIARKGVRTF